jgi:hypothetical protein
MASFLLLLSLFFLLLLAPFSSPDCTDQRRRARMIRASGCCERALAQIWRHKVMRSWTGASIMEK